MTHTYKIPLLRKLKQKDLKLREQPVKHTHITTTKREISIMQGYLSYLSVAVIEWPDRKQLGETGLVWTCSYSRDVSPS